MNSQNLKGIQEAAELMNKKHIPTENRYWYNPKTDKIEPIGKKKYWQVIK